MAVQPPHGTLIRGRDVVCKFPADPTRHHSGRAGIATTAWVTASEVMHYVRNVHGGDPGYTCPTAKTGVLGGAAFLNLNASLFWLLYLMLAGNADLAHPPLRAHPSRSPATARAGRRGGAAGAVAGRGRSRGAKRGRTDIVAAVDLAGVGEERRSQAGE
uniref:Uncharacterized protein n=1 Tax=Oryza meridionalis TaxID=40149 RepID=A0A0E0DUD4_9ORYZ